MVSRTRVTVKNLNTDLTLYRLKLQHENLVHKHHTAHLERKRAVEAMRQHTQAKNAWIQHSTLKEATERMSPALARYYHDKIAELAKQRGAYGP